MQKWPKQSDVDGFYGNPRGVNGQASQRWRERNLTTIKPPFKMFYAGKPVSKITVHRKCAESLARVFNDIWGKAGKKQSVIDGWGVSTLGGVFEYRLKRNSNTLSMHAYACAIDMDPVNKPLGQTSRRFPAVVVKCFTDEGWVNLPRDPMHFQAAVP